MGPELEEADVTAPATSPAVRRRRGTRQQAEADLLAAARRLMERDGVLAGVNLRKIAVEAGVNHGQIYQYFGNRRALLRAALSETARQHFATLPNYWTAGFAERRRRMFWWGLEHQEVVRLQALLALDGDDDLVLLPELRRSLEALDRDMASGELDPDADAVVAHVMTSAAARGYQLFRDIFARETGIPVDELDQRAAAVYDHMLNGLVAGQQAGTSPPGSGGQARPTTPAATAPRQSNKVARASRTRDALDIE